MSNVTPIRPGVEAPSAESIETMLSRARGLISYRAATYYWRKKFERQLLEQAISSEVVETITTNLTIRAREEADSLSSLIASKVKP